MGVFHAEDRPSALMRMLHVKGIDAHWYHHPDSSDSKKISLVFKNEKDRLSWGNKRWVVFEYGASPGSVPTGGRMANVIAISEWKKRKAAAEKTLMSLN